MVVVRTHNPIRDHTSLRLRNSIATVYGALGAGSIQVLRLFDTLDMFELDRKSPWVASVMSKRLAEKWEAFFVAEFARIQANPGKS
jgi:hypothetical protein